MKKFIYICGDEKLKEQALSYLNVNEGDTIIQNNMTVLLDPFGSVVKSMLLSAYKHETTNVYVVASVNEGEEPDASDLRLWLLDNGIEKDTLQLFDYLEKYDRPTINEWLDVTNVEQTMHKNIQMLKKHPLLPNTLTFTGLIVDKTENIKMIE